MCHIHTCVILTPYNPLPIPSLSATSDEPKKNNVGPLLIYFMYNKYHQHYHLISILLFFSFFLLERGLDVPYTSPSSLLDKCVRSLTLCPVFPPLYRHAFLRCVWERYRDVTQKKTKQPPTTAHPPPRTVKCGAPNSAIFLFFQAIGNSKRKHTIHTYTWGGA